MFSEAEQRKERSVIYSLPYPPTVNTYWRQFRGRTILSARGREFRTEALACILHDGKPRTMTERLRVTIEASPPDNRRRDIDNIVKPVLDALEHAGVYQDDCQIDDLHVKRGPVVKGGDLVVSIEVADFESA